MLKNILLVTAMGTELPKTQDSSGDSDSNSDSEVCFSYVINSNWLIMAYIAININNTLLGILHLGHSEYMIYHEYE